MGLINASNAKTVALRGCQEIASGVSDVEFAAEHLLKKLEIEIQVRKITKLRESIELLIENS